MLESMGQGVPAALAYGRALANAPPDQALDPPTLKAVTAAASSMAPTRASWASTSGARWPSPSRAARRRSADASRLSSTRRSGCGAASARSRPSTTTRVCLRSSSTSATSFPGCRSSSRPPRPSARSSSTSCARRKADSRPTSITPSTCRWTSGGGSIIPGAGVPTTSSIMEIRSRIVAEGRRPRSPRSHACPRRRSRGGLRAQCIRRSQPRTRIPPHTGVANFRLVVHLPLIVPPGCRFRVGGEVARMARRSCLGLRRHHRARGLERQRRAALHTDLRRMESTPVAGGTHRDRGDHRRDRCVQRHGSRSARLIGPDDPPCS